MDTTDLLGLSALSWANFDEGDYKTAGITTGVVAGASSTTTLPSIAYDLYEGVKEARSNNASLTTYVSAMSDEELESALTKFGLLEKEENKKNIIK